MSKKFMWMRPFWQGFIEFLVAAPILVLIRQFLWPIEPWLFVLLVIAGYALSYGLAQLIRVYRVGYDWSIAIILGSATGYFIVGQNVWANVVVGLVAIIIYMRGFSMARGNWERIFPNYAPWIGILLHLGIAFLMMFNESWQLNRTALLITGILLFGYTIFFQNSQHLQHASFSAVSERVPPAIKRVHRKALIVLFILTLAVGSYSQISSWITEHVRKWLTALLNMIYNVEDNAPVGEQSGGVPQQPPPLFDGPVKEENQFALMLVYIISALVLLVIVALIVYFIVRKAIPWIWAILKKLFGVKEVARQNETVGYIDIEEKIDKKPKRHKLRKRAITRSRNEASSYTEKIRERYRQTVLRAKRKGMNVRQSDTPFEVADGYEQQFPEQSLMMRTLSKLYTKARYSQEEITEQEFESLKDR